MTLHYWTAQIHVAWTRQVGGISRIGCSSDTDTSQICQKMSPLHIHFFIFFHKNNTAATLGLPIWPSSTWFIASWHPSSTGCPFHQTHRTPLGNTGARRETGAHHQSLGASEEPPHPRRAPWQRQPRAAEQQQASTQLWANNDSNPSLVGWQPPVIGFFFPLKFLTSPFGCWLLLEERNAIAR